MVTIEGSRTVPRVPELIGISDFILMARRKKIIYREYLASSHSQLKARRGEFAGLLGQKGYDLEFPDDRCSSSEKVSCNSHITSLQRKAETMVEESGGGRNDFGSDY